MPGSEETSPLSPWWRHSAILVMIAGFAVLSYLTVRTYTDAPPIPDRVEDISGRTLFTSDDILRGQEVFLKYGLMEHDTLWGHGAYPGPDYSADTVHEAVEVGRDTLAQGRYGRPYATLEAGPAAEIADAVRRMLKENRYDPATGTLRFTEIEAAALAESRRHWGDYFSGSTAAAGLPQKYIRERTELNDLATYFTWAAWAAVANRPGKDYSYTNNWPYDPAAGNTPSGPTYLWSALSLITLLGGLGTILFLFGRFDYLGWHQASTAGHSHDNRLLAWTWTPSQRATAWYLAVVAVLFLAQTLLGGVIAHYRVLNPFGCGRPREQWNHVSVGRWGENEQPWINCSPRPYLLTSDAWIPYGREKRSQVLLPHRHCRLVFTKPSRLRRGYRSNLVGATSGTRRWTVGREFSDAEQMHSGPDRDAIHQACRRRPRRRADTDEGRRRYQDRDGREHRVGCAPVED